MFCNFPSVDSDYSPGVLFEESDSVQHSHPSNAFLLQENRELREKIVALEDQLEGRRLELAHLQGQLTALGGQQSAQAVSANTDSGQNSSTEIVAPTDSGASQSQPSSGSDTDQIQPSSVENTPQSRISTEANGSNTAPAQNSSAEITAPAASGSSQSQVLGKAFCLS